MKILIIHTSAGAGHTKAAEALYNGIKNSTNHSAILVNALDYTYPFFKTSYQSCYSFLVQKIPGIWGLFFAISDLPWIRPAVKVLRRILNGLNADRLNRFLIQENFDAILSTHFFPNEVAANLKKKGFIKARIISVVTDFDVHSIWVARTIDRFTVACDYTKKVLIGLGVEEHKISVTGIPVHAKFLQPLDKKELKARFDLRENMFTILVATGSFGMGPIEELVEAFKDYQVLVVCGHNKGLFERLSIRKLPQVKVFGLVDNMHELMAVSQVMITKPGGLSITEALVKNLPLIFFSAIPGQETKNVRVLMKYGIVKRDIRFKEIYQEIKRLSSSGTELESLKKRIEQLARPTAVEDIIHLIDE